MIARDYSQLSVNIPASEARRFPLWNGASDSKPDTVNHPIQPTFLVFEVTTIPVIVSGFHEGGSTGNPLVLI